jgi:outer membrane protein OmpA-like peptidoglycan-associated protein/cell division protein FtsB
MRSSVIDEGEHRRGLILGLTLAESLLLLLFLLVLAFAARIDTLRVEKQRAENVLDRVKKASLPPDDPEAGLVYVRDLETKIEQLEAANTKLTDIMKALKEDPAKLIAMQVVIEEARTINPNDPPAVLKLGLGMIDAAGKDTNPTDVKTAMREFWKAKGKSPAGGGAGGHNWPPIITLSEADGHFFESGSAELSPEFRNVLTGSMLEKLMGIIKQYDVNVIEVVGHTDEQRVSGERVSNLDKTLFPSLQSKTAPTAPDAPIASDNAGLGLARAVSVVRVLSNDPRLSRLRILPLSGAQLIDLGDKLAAGTAPGAVKERRRIEIRVRRSDK